MNIVERRVRSMLCFIAYQDNGVSNSAFGTLDRPIVNMLIERNQVVCERGKVRYIKGIETLGPTPAPMAQTADVAKFLADDAAMRAKRAEDAKADDMAKLEASMLEVLLSDEIDWGEEEENCDIEAIDS